VRSLATAGDGRHSKLLTAKRREYRRYDVEFIGEVRERFSVHAQLPRHIECCAVLGRNSSDGETADPRELLSRPAPIATQVLDGTLVPQATELRTIHWRVTLGTEGFIGFDHISLFDNRDFKIVVLNDLK